ncbi:XTP/dITP diphosphohydrolase [Mesorhizobium soli]|uniref:non-canonical purine NTP pyrophosphatase n=1 Tax=Pseudaminobacter soli (ex Li et al. 2025) TaxID=1295366 RepID=UPI0024747C10|nr:non-canonical purine NTP pyrophosphatase [Mesorhizobium soli]MDH6234924.1 XTP/dITP diphosphohydrolase [Mesorhizobium soli]
MNKISIYYATRSEFKKQEIAAIEEATTYKAEDATDQLVGERFKFVFSDVKTDEPLEVDLATMVRHKAVSAYKSLLMPCIVEHAGLILLDHANSGYPGGLTQPMMDALGAEDFVRRISAAGERAVARAVIGYCDGMCVHIFTGDTEGAIADKPRGGREFYWDTIFAPDGYDGATYAEISAKLGIREKMKVSQSRKALQQFLDFRVRRGANSLFMDFDR